jgi:hypothetical protein
VIEKVGPIKNPLTIIAVFASVVEISCAYVLPSISISLQGTYIWFLMLFPILLVVAFFIVLWFKPYVLYAPSDYKDDANFIKFFDSEKDYEENETLTAKSLAEPIANAVEEHAKNVNDYHVTDENKLTITTKKNIDEISPRFSCDPLKDSVYLRKNYSKDAYAFKFRILNILSDLGISSEPSNKENCMDIIARKKDGKIIPIAVRYYQAPLTDGPVVVKLEDSIKRCMARLGTDESILIISSHISSNASKLLNGLFSKEKLHIITGTDERLLISKLKRVFGLRD